MKNLLQLLFLLIIQFTTAQTLLIPERVFDGMSMHENWVVLVNGNVIEYAGSRSGLDAAVGTEEIELPGMTLMPGLIEGHSHILLHPYNETSWNDQVLKESPVERSIRATNHVKASLMAGVTTMRDLGSEGAGYSDVYIKKSIEEGIIPGPRLLVAGPAIVATGAYGPKGFHDGVTVPLGAEEASGNDVIATVRRQIGNGADFIKIYADYRWQAGAASQPTFSMEEMKLMVETAKSAGTYAVAHASTPEGMRRAILAGVETIEHGDDATMEIYELMKKNNVALCPTLAAGDAISQYSGWNKKVDPEPERIVNKRKSFAMALKSGVTIAFGGDVGVYSHGENYRELELMVDYGMEPLEVLKTATSGNASIFHLNQLGNIQPKYLADLIAVDGDPSKNIGVMRNVTFVMKDGNIYKNAN
ncbi:amidohydrolase [Nonlabens sp. YIK11]|uniref:metal-dependent hydrolase family protein n=1 Tax=Nonlabens sp. YIK11 TaxID=1453349 RepID=UPI0006DC9194|nr:amidohydrolase family protein [Nonlabens sp. YIK11]KQC33482.1 amidohydrolase [Nonlabens sp. YIK11]